MIIAMNRFLIRHGYEKAFEERWKSRESFLDQNPGFLRLRLLKTELKKSATPSGPQEDCFEYVSHSEWLDRPSFESWLEGDLSKKAHNQSEPLPRETYLGPPVFRLYEPILDEVRGHRVDARSSLQDEIVNKHFSQESPAQKELSALNKKADLMPISIGPFEGRIIEILLKSNHSKRGIEIGTLGGYSASWITRALPADGHLISIEKDPQTAKIARQHLDQLGLGERIEIRTGDALDVLKELDALKDLDFVFIDADKNNYPNYARWAIPRLKKGGLILADNAYIWGGMHYYGRPESEVVYPTEDTLHAYRKNQFIGMSECWKELSAHPELASIVLPTGDGLAVAVKL